MSVDFEALRTRMRESMERLTGVGGASQETQLRERGKRLAALRLRSPDRHVAAQIIVVRRERALLGLPVSHTDEVREVSVSRLPVPCHHIVGLFQLRGRLHCLVDLQPFVGASTELRHGEHTLAILVHGARGPLGIRVDEVVGPRTVFADEIDTSQRDRRLEHVRHVTRDCVELIDVDTLFASPFLQLEQTRDR